MTRKLYTGPLLNVTFNGAICEHAAECVRGNASFADRVTGAFIDRDERAGKGASDHAPVIVDLAT